MTHTPTEGNKEKEEGGKWPLYNDLRAGEKKVLTEASQKTEDPAVEVVVGKEGGQAQEEKEEEGEGKVKGLKEEEKDE